MAPARVARLLIAALCVLLSSAAVHAAQLTPVVSGLSNPVFVGHAGDNTNRLFIVEKAGIIKVLQPGSWVPTVFLDIQSKVAMDGEQGLVGLAFHPRYFNNRRFFVFYARASDGTIIIAEYKANETNANVADPGERIFMEILTLGLVSLRRHAGVRLRG